MGNVPEKLFQNIISYLQVLARPNFGPSPLRPDERRTDTFHDPRAKRWTGPGCRHWGDQETRVRSCTRRVDVARIRETWERNIGIRPSLPCSPSAPTGSPPLAEEYWPTTGVRRSRRHRYCWPCTCTCLSPRERRPRWPIPDPVLWYEDPVARTPPPSRAEHDTTCKQNIWKWESSQIIFGQFWNNSGEKV